MQAEKQGAQKNPAPAGAKTVVPTARQTAGTAKPKKKISGGAILAIMLVVIIIAAAVVVYLNVGGLRQKLADALQTEQAAADGETASVDAAQLEEKQKELDQMAADLDTQSAALKKKSQELKDKEKALGDQETALKAREETVTAAETDMAQTQQTQDDLTATAKIFESMEPAVAATAIAGLKSVDDMVALLLKMPSDKAADILGNMEAKLATQVLSAMMK